MGVQRFVGSNNREAMGRVRAALGDDALILANRATDQGVEILALAEDDASGYASSPRAASAPAGPRPAAPGERPAPAAPVTTAAGPDLTEQLLREVRDMRDQLNRRAPAAGEGGPRSVLRRRLRGAGFSAEFSEPLLAALPPEARHAQQADDWLQRQLQRRLSVAAPGDLDQPGVIALIGPTGVGKTTTAAKLAARLAHRHGAERVALVSADNYRIGARDQLRIYADLLGVALYSLDENQPLDSLAGSLADRPWVVVDTIGMSQRDARLGEQLRQLSGAVAVRPVLLLNAASQGETLEEVVAVYRGTARTAGLALDDAIISKQDEASRLGPVLDTAIRHGLRLHFVCRGQRVPEDMVAADPAGLVDDALALTGDGGEDNQPGAAGWTRRVLAQGRALEAAVSLLREGAPGFHDLEQRWRGGAPQPGHQHQVTPSARLWRGGARLSPVLALDTAGLPLGVPATASTAAAQDGAARLLPAPPDAALWRTLQGNGEAWLAAARANNRVWYRGRRLPLSECYPLAGPWDSLMVRHRGRPAQLRLRRLDLAASPATRGPAGSGEAAPFTALLCAWFGELRDLDSGRSLGRRYWLAPAGQSRACDSGLLRTLLRCEEWPALTERAAGWLGEGDHAMAGDLAALAIRLDQDDSDWALDLRAQLLSLAGTRRRTARSLLQALLRLFSARRDLQRLGAVPGGGVDA